MTKHINVNPGQYKVAGREKPGEPLDSDDKQREAISKAHLEERKDNKAAPKENRKS